MHNENASTKRYVDAQGLIDALFDEGSRPSVRWVRQMTRLRTIPYLKIGGLVRFDIEAVRSALENECTVRSR